MAVDTRQKRFSMMSAVSPSLPSVVLPEADGTIDLDDRQHFLELYSGIPLAVAGEMALDAVGTNDLQFFGDAVRSTDVPTELSGETNAKSVDFDGDADYLSKDSPTGMPTAYPVTLSCWIKTSVSQQHAPIWLGDSTLHGEYLAIDSSGTGFPRAVRREPTSHDWAESSVDIDDGDWHHIAAVLDASAAEIFIDGTSRGTSSATVAFPTINRVAIGGLRDFSPSSYVDGLVDDVRIYDVALSGTQISDLAAGTDVTDDLVAHWPLNEGASLFQAAWAINSNAIIGA